MAQQLLAKIAWDTVGQKAVEGTISSLIGGTVGKLFGGSSNSAKAAAQQYHYNLKLQQQQQDWNEYMYKNRFQMQKQDMINAEINPLFGMGQAPTVTSGTNSVGMADMVGEQNNKIQQILSAIDTGQNLSAKRAQTKLIENQAKTEEINTNLKTIEVEEKNIINLMNRIRLKYLDAKEKAEIQNQVSQSKQNISTAQKNISDINTSELNNKKTERIEEWHRKHPKLSGIFTGLSEGGQTLLGLVMGGGSVAIAKNARKKANTARKARR